MALIKCPNCGNDISDKAKRCPKCSQQLALDNTNLPRDTDSKKVAKYLGLGISLFIIVCIIVIASNTATTKSKRSYYSYDNSYSKSSSYSVPKTGNERALAKAQSYLNSSAFSYTGLLDQLEYEGFTES